MSRIPPPPALHSAAGSQEEVTVVGERSFAQRDAECRKRAIDLDTESPRKRGRAVAAALEERVVSARSVCTAAVDKRVRELTMPAIEQWNAGQIDGAERRGGGGRRGGPAGGAVARARARAALRVLAGLKQKLLNA